MTDLARLLLAYPIEALADALHRCHSISGDWHYRQGGLGLLQKGRQGRQKRHFTDAYILRDAREQLAAGVYPNLHQAIFRTAVLKYGQSRKAARATASRILKDQKKVAAQSFTSSAEGPNSVCAD